MATVLSNPDYRANMSKHGHDVSQTKKFTSSVGHLLPVYYDYLSPGDKVYIKDKILTRTMDLETSAMCDLTEHIDYFFVPFEQIYSVFGSWFYGVNDVSSSLVNPALIDSQLPQFSRSALTEFLNLEYDASQGTYEELSKDQFGVAKSDNVIRLWQLFGFGNFPYYLYGCFEDGEPVHTNVEPGTGKDYFIGLQTLSMVLPACYQKIYSDYYRLSDREHNDASLYSLDRFYDSRIPTAQDIEKFFTMRYRPLKKDLFTSAQISPIFSEYEINALQNNTMSFVNQWLTGVHQFYIGVAGDTAEGAPNRPSGYVGLSTEGEYMQGLSLNAPNIQTVFAINKLLEITRRAGKHYDKQTLAHFGQDVPDGISGEVFYLGSHSSKIVIGDVLATATNSSDDTYLGQVGGKGYGFQENNDVIQFKAPAHGVLMAIYSCVPEIEYQPTGVDRLNTYLNPYDFWMPEFDKLGMQPLFRYQTNIFGADGKPIDNASQAEIIGWNYRYAELKVKLDLCLGGFSSTLDYWSTSKDGQKDSQLYNYLCDPSYLDKIMLLNFLPAPTSAYMPQNCFDHDPLLHMIRFDVKKVSGMSTFGIQNL